MPRLSTIVTRGLAELHTLAHAGRPPSKGLRILMYHSIGSQAHGDRLGLYGMTPARFSSQMAMLAEATDIKTTSIVDAACSESATRVAVTFDDGYRDNLHIVAPRFRDMGQSATSNPAKAVDSDGDHARSLRFAPCRLAVVKALGKAFCDLKTRVDSGCQIVLCVVSFLRTIFLDEELIFYFRMFFLD
jgi:hypothetical protein